MQYRGGLSLQEAVEQRQLGTYWVYSQSGSAPTVQKLPWLVNTFFSKCEGLLPRVAWKNGTWVDDPYNVPEMVAEYPEPSILGILPAYGIYARHIEGLVLQNVALNYVIQDKRPAIVLDDVSNADLRTVAAKTALGVKTVVTVTNHYKRHVGNEYVPEEPYFTTTCENLKLGLLSLSLIHI